jgi:hypothetical protein
MYGAFLVFDEGDVLFVSRTVTKPPRQPLLQGWMK